ncbi:MAG: IgGFc-binding protein [Myxococcales bacterium]|nr:IgGFc-binding protein [Myxococcales bacterium]
MRKSLLLPAVMAAACATSTGIESGPTPGGAGATGAAGAPSGGDGGINVEAGPKSSNSCEAAAAARSYLGCEFWPTVVANNVWSSFDFAAVVANAGSEPAVVKVERGSTLVATATVQPGSLEKLHLPWIPELKGGDADECGNSVSLDKSVRVPDGAYRLTSSVPVTVYQFNALEYRGEGGPVGKDWSSCPGNKQCAGVGAAVGCYSFSNDASLLLPTTALTGTYRLVGQKGWPMVNMPPYFAITGTEDGTKVTVKLTDKATTVAGFGIPAADKSVSYDLTLDRGEVVQIVASPSSDLAGTLVSADKPVQVISGMPCVNQPFDLAKAACDHIEESVFPAETLGKRYFVTAPTGPNGKSVGQLVRLVGNADGTTLGYPAGAPPNAPTSLDAGQVVDLDVVNDDFEIEGSQAFAIVTFQLGGSIVDADKAPHERRGDPSQSAPVSVEQYRKKYVFLAPDDYDESYVDIVQKSGTTVTLDGAVVSEAAKSLSSGYEVRRVKLGAGQGGAHVLEATSPVGVQVVGYGKFTSYQYPGGLDLQPITPPPVK